AAGDAYVTGWTNSAAFPVTAGAFETSSGIASGTGGVAFVSKLNPAGSGLIYSTFLGKAIALPTTFPASRDTYNFNTAGTRIAVDAAGDAFVTGMTGSTSFLLVNPVQATNTGYADAFVSVLNPSGSGLSFSTYLGGAGGSDMPTGIGLDGQGNVYVAGLTGATSFPVTAGAVQTTNSGWAGFAAKIAAPLPAPHPTLAVTGFPPATTAGVAGTITVTAENADGSVNTGYTGTVHFTSSDPQAVLPADYTFAPSDAGVHTFTV